MTPEPKGELAIRVVAMPKDTNPSGDVFGGWLISQMDLAGIVFCRKIAKVPITTVTIDSTTFKEPVFVGDTLCCYVSLVKIGRTSITILLRHTLIEILKIPALKLPKASLSMLS